MKYELQKKLAVRLEKEREAAYRREIDEAVQEAMAEERERLAKEEAVL